MWLALCITCICHICIHIYVYVANLYSILVISVEFSVVALGNPPYILHIINTEPTYLSLCTYMSNSNYPRYVSEYETLKSFNPIGSW